MQARGYCLGIIPMQKSRKMGILGQNLRVVSYFHYHHHLLQGKMQSTGCPRKLLMLRCSSHNF